MYTVVMKKREAAFTTRFKKWLQAQPHDSYSAAYEIKVTTKKSIPFSAVEKHQVDALLQVKENFFMFKIPDSGYQNPFDMFVMNKQQAFIVLAFLTPRKPARVWVVDINLFITIRENQHQLGIKSVNEESLTLYHGNDCHCHIF
jgi:penicillin-binding protein-related factor A (putative recombinase)